MNTYKIMACLLFTLLVYPSIAFSAWGEMAGTEYQLKRLNETNEKMKSLLQSNIELSGQIKELIKSNEESNKKMTKMTTQITYLTWAIFIVTLLQFNAIRSAVDYILFQPITSIGIKLKNIRKKPDNNNENN